MAVINSHRFNIISLLFFLLLNIYSRSIIAATVDFNLFVREFGDAGIGYIKFNLTHGLHPGTLVSIVSRTYNRGIIDIIDDDWNNLLHITVKTKGKSEFYLNSYIDKKWLPGGVELKDNPVVNGALTVTTIAYEVDGYRIFVNTKEVAFFKHRSTNPPRAVLAFKNTIYKIVYYVGKQSKCGINKYMLDIAELINTE